MQDTNTLLIVGTIFLVLIIIQALMGNRHPFRKTFFNSLLGVTSLVGVNILSPIIGVSLPISILSLIISALAGIPGVTMMIAINIINCT